MNTIILCLLVYPIEPYLWATSMKTLGYKYTKYRHTYQFIFLGYYGIALVKSLFIGNLPNDILKTVFSVGLVAYMVACTLILYEGKTSKKLIWVSAFLSLVFLTELVALGFSSIVLHQPATIYAPQTTVSIICTLMAKILLFGTCQLVFFWKEGTLLNALFENKEIVPLVLSTCLVEMTASAFMKSMTAEHNQVGIAIYIVIQIAFILLTVYVILIVSRKNKQIKYIKAELENNKRSEESLEKLAKLQHDIAGHMYIMYIFCKKGQYDYLEQYISQVYKETQIPSAFYDTPDPALSILVGDLHRKAIQLQIDFHAHIVMDKFYMNSVDTCSLVSNILNNALEAAVKLPTCHRRIDFQMLYCKGGYTVECMNNALKNTTFDNTTKSDKENHGYGLQIIRDIIKKYHGEILEKMRMPIDGTEYITVNIRIYFPVKEVKRLQEKEWLEQEKANAQG